MNGATATGGSNPRALPGGPIALFGAGVANTAAARALVARGHDIVLTDDGDPRRLSELADELGCSSHHRPDRAALEMILSACGSYMATPGLPESHPALAVASELGTPGLSEFDLAAAWDGRDLVSVTGTNGKTTVVTLVAAMLEASGIPCAAVGNLEVPLVEAIADPRPECFVVEASSFRLAHSAHFAPKVGTWLNFAADHLDVHRDLGSYRAAKARIWADQGPGDVAVYNLDDPVVAAEARSVPRGVQPIGFTLRGDAGSDPSGQPAFHCAEDTLCTADGVAIARVDELWSRLPHDQLNVLASAATALAAGASMDGVRRAAADFPGLPHRVEFLGSRDRVRYYNDSKATTPHATLAALAGFDSVVLIAGGRNKGVDLSVLGSAPNVSAVVGIGESAVEVTGAFPGVPSAIAADMQDAAARALSMAQPGDVVLLSPGCASFDWYGSYLERGDEFRSVVQRLLDADADHGGGGNAPDGAGGGRPG